MKATQKTPIMKQIVIGHDAFGDIMKSVPANRAERRLARRIANRCKQNQPLQTKTEAPESGDAEN